MMEWNDLLTELNYYLANLYLWDSTNKTKIRLYQSSGLPAGLIDWQEPPVNVWFLMLKGSADRFKVPILLEKIIADSNQDDEFLKGAYQTIKAGKKAASKDVKNDEWKGGRLTEEKKEKILGRRSTLLPISFLAEGVAASKAVVRIEYGDESGTGFVIPGNWMLTNNHVLPDKATALQATIQFGYQLPEGIPIMARRVMDIKPEYTARLNPGKEDENLFFTNKTEDWTLVKLESKDNLVYPALKFSEIAAQDGDFVNIIQHPLGGPKQIGIYNNMVMYAGEGILQYMTDTNDGSSGSPVFNSNWEVVAIHHSGGWVKDGKNAQAVRRNQGTAISLIKSFMTDNKIYG